MTESTNYQKAYERQKKARERAEQQLELRSRELYEANEILKNAYNTLKDQKAQLVQQEKLASIGMLAAGVAHEINNPVGFVKSNLQTLQDYTKSYSTVLAAYRTLTELVEQKDSDSTIKKHLTDLKTLLKTTDLDYIAKDGIDCIEESLTGIGRVEEIITNLRDFARTDSDERTQVDMNECVDSAIKLVRNEIKYSVDMSTEYGEIPKVWACFGQLQQVFINIIMNAVQAMEREGSLAIRTSNDDYYVHVDFIDSGPGINEEHLTKLFDPFFTTKDVGSGTGLGLYISHGLVEKHKGKLRAFNEPAAGARFRVSVPLEIRGAREE